MKARAYLPEPGSLTAALLRHIHAAGSQGLTSWELARAIDRNSNALNAMARTPLAAGVIETRLIAGRNACGDRRAIRIYVARPDLRRCIDYLEQADQSAAAPAMSTPSHPALDAWLRRAAAYIPRIPQAGWRGV